MKKRKPNIHADDDDDDDVDDDSDANGVYCPHCQNVYKNKLSLSKHVYMKHNPKGDTVKCSKCDKDISRNNIAKHNKLCKN